MDTTHPRDNIHSLPVRHRISSQLPSRTQYESRFDNQKELGLFKAQVVRQKDGAHFALV